MKSSDETVSTNVPTRLTEDQLTHFAQWGYVALRDVVDPAAIDETQTTVRRHLTRQNVFIDGAYQLDAMPFVEAPLAHSNLVKGLKKNTHIGAMITAAVRGYCRQVIEAHTGHADEPTNPTMDRAQLLFTWPNAREWSIPSSIWHTDFPRIPGEGFAGVQVFAFVEAVEPHGGGTLIAAGSHHLVNEGRYVKSKLVKKLLKKKPGYAALFDKHGEYDRERLLEPFEVDGHPQRIVELTGRPGDIFLTDLRLLHTLAPNASQRPRVMLTQRFVRDAAMDAFKEVLAERAA